MATFRRRLVGRLHPERLALPLTSKATVAIESLENRQYCADSAGNNFATARNLGAISSTTLVVPELVSSADRDDFYKFSIGTAGTTTLRLDTLTSNADLQLYNSTGTTLLGFSSQGGLVADQIIKSLSAGNYYARVKWVGSASASYKLKLTAPAAAEPGSTTATAKVLGSIGTATVGYTGTVNKTSDTVDYFKITTPAKGLLNLNVTTDVATASTPPGGTVSVSLYSSAGTLLQTRTANELNGQMYFGTTAAATYYIKITPVATATGVVTGTVNYSLTVSNGALPVDTVGNTRATASPESALSSKHYIVNGSNQDDWYSLPAKGLTGTQFFLRGCTGNLTFAIVNSSGVVLQRSTPIGDSPGPLTTSQLDVGRQTQLFLHVFQTKVGALGSCSSYYFLVG